LYGCVRGVDDLVDAGRHVGGAGRGVVTAAEGQFALVRLDTLGAPDPTFGDAGVRLTDWGQPSAIEQLTPTDAGLIAWGQVRNPDDLDLAAVRSDAAGGVDVTYADGNGGAGVLEPSPGPDDASVVVRDGDGHRVGGGAFQLRRVTASGTFDASFGDGGTLDLDFANTATFADGTIFSLFSFSGSPTGTFGSVTSTGSGSYSGLNFTGLGGVWTALFGGQQITFSELTGELRFQNSSSPVPEIDPTSFGSALTLLIGSLGLLERRARRRTQA
jgi:hypothetical protein